MDKPWERTTETGIEYIEVDCLLAVAEERGIEIELLHKDAVERTETFVGELREKDAEIERLKKRVEEQDAEIERLRIDWIFRRATKAKGGE